MSNFQMTLEVKDTEIEVEVEFNEGFYIPAQRSGHIDNWTPEEGEHPEVLHVFALKPDGSRSKDILNKLPWPKRDAIRDEAWRLQQDRERYADVD